MEKIYNQTETVTNNTAVPERQHLVIQLNSPQTGKSKLCGVCSSVIPRLGSGEWGWSGGGEGWGCLRDRTSAQQWGSQMAAGW